MTRNIPFTKMVGTGNDFLIVDTVHHTLGSLKTGWPRVARAMCDRRYGVGADGVLILERSRVADARMRIFNPDGSEAEMCGNGARCVAQYVKSLSVEGGGWKVEGDVTIETKAGVVTADVQGGRVTMRMPDPQDLRTDLRVDVDHQSWRLSCVDTGVPHVVVVVEHLNQVDVERLGRQLRFHRAFQPRGTNVNFVELNPRRRHHLRIRTYERGVEGETLACGTGVTAAAVIHAIRNHPEEKLVRHRVEVETRSGETLRVSLMVATQGTMRRITNVTLEGAVRSVCQGVFPWSTKGSS